MCACVCVSIIHMSEGIHKCLCIPSHGDALVESIAFNRRVVGSTRALAAM